VLDETLPLEQAILPVTRNVARLLRLDDRKGRIGAGTDADLVLLDADMKIVEVYARGRQMLGGGQPVVRGWFEGKNHSKLPRG
jgi:beta-aspartyl-dipeptidase (metallo-type)